jgi:hypothetical protein
LRRNLCLVPVANYDDRFIISTQGKSFIISPIDDDSSAMSQSCDILRESFGVECSLKTMNCFLYLGDIQHLDEEYSIILFQFDKNHGPNFDKKSVAFIKEEKEFRFMFPETEFVRNDSFNLAVGLKLTSL